MKRTILTLMISFFALVCSGQTIEDLRRQIANAEAEIRAANELLGKTQADRTNVRSKLRLVQNNISNRQKIVATLDQQIYMINRDINAKSGAIRNLEEELAKLKAEYAMMVRTSYRSLRTNNIMAFIFASKDFHDVTQRIYYVRRYTLMREKKAELIDSVSVQLNVDLGQLALQKASLDSTVRNRNVELTNLDKERKDFRQMDTSLSSQVRQYNTQISEQQNRIKSLQDKIQQIIAEEARRSQNTQRTTAEQEAFVQLTGRFDQNKGRLPYPVSGGVIIEPFGTHTHPVHRNVTVNKSGITLAAERGATVRSVFEGEVVRIFFAQGMNNTVLISHGSYFTNYSNLETVSVKVGDKVSINQSIGKIYSGDNPTNYILLFGIWKNTEKLNPEEWLRR